MSARGEKIMSKSLVAALEPSAPGATFAAGDVLNGASDAKLEAFVKANAWGCPGALLSHGVV